VVERREAVRIPLVVKVSLHDSDEAHYYFSKDISSGGMFLETKEAFPVGSNVALDFSLPINGKQHQMKISGEIVREVINNSTIPEGQIPGMGVRFMLLSQNSRNLLDQFIDEILSNQRPS